MEWTTDTQLFYVIVSFLTLFLVFVILEIYSRYKDKPWKSRQWKNPKWDKEKRKWSIVGLLLVGSLLSICFCSESLIAEKRPRV